MKQIILRILAVVLLSGLALGKDHSGEYQTGTVSTAARSTGFDDNTQCSEALGTVHCSGGIQETSEQVRILTTADGSKLVLHHQVGRPDTVKHLADGTQVQYRIERHMGVNVILIQGRLERRLVITRGK